MRNNDTANLTRRMEKRKKRRRRGWLLSLTGGMVAAATAYALMMPAKTLQQEVCQKQEHLHTEACYALVEEPSSLACQLELHVHDDGCLDETGQLICGYADFVVHTHDAFCYDETGTLVCTLPEIETHTHDETCWQVTGHVHDEDCYGQPGLGCGLEETPGHTHDENCFPVPEEPTCGLEEGEEHTHDESCFPVPEEPVCGLEEAAGHTHTEDCYDTEQELICELEETEPDTVLICEQEEIVLHTHEESCLDAEGNLICGQIQILEHQHTRACQAELPLTCEKEEDEDHTHGPMCYGTWELVCQLEEHTHTEECYLSADEQGVQEFTYEDALFSLVVTVESPQPLPEDTVLCVTDAAEELYDTIPLAIGEDEAMGDGQWILRDICLLHGEEQLDTAGFTMTAQIQWKSQPAAAALDLEDESTAGAMELLAWQVDDTEGLRPIDTTLYTAGEEPAVLTGQITTGTLVLRSQNAEEIEYTVQYYGYMLRSTQEGANTTLPVIDTSGGILPTNAQGTNVKTIQMPLKATGTNQYQVNSVSTLMELYATNTYTYLSAPNVRYLDKLEESTGYTLSQIWILKEGAQEDSTEESDWDIYGDISDIHFTSRPEFAEDKDNVICVTTGTVMRLVYENVTSQFTTSATFYDYDITGQNDNYPYYNTNQQGINSLANYHGATSNKLAFGNKNTATGLDDQKSIDGYLMNCANSSGYKDCCFGLVSGLDANGKIQFTVNAPYLFNEGSATGKTVYENSSLTFSRDGDTYTLSSATVNGKQTVSNLNLFNNPTNGSTTYTNIFTNNFWPMDQESNADPKFGGSTSVSYWGYNDVKSTFPASDDGVAHNSYFGLQYAVQFTLTEDYIGPLDYVFYGDDDMWVFLDDQLICDIGGVHSSVGEYVNLWDYIAKGSAGSHTLSFFYTERGASGSTCYMSFTLPSVTGVEIEQKSSNLTIGKKVVGSSDPDKEFTFQIRFYDANGNPILDDYSYEKFNADGTSASMKLVLSDGEIFTLKDGQYIVARNLPYGLRYTVEEIDLESIYTPSCTVNGLIQTGGTAKGTVLLNQSNTVWFTNTVESVSLNVNKVGPDGLALSGAVFQLVDSSGAVVSFQSDVDSGSYTRPTSVGDDVTQGGAYYIALSSNPDYVLGLNGMDVVLRPRDTGQVFTVNRQDDGSYTFLSSGGYLDVYNGDLANGTKLIVWNGDDSPNDNEKWFLTRNSDGSLTFRSRKAVLSNSAAVMDLDGATVADGQKIQLYTSNDTSAQKWILLPAGGTSSEDGTTQDLVVNAQGQLHLHGLLPGTYMLVEISPPSGYQLPEKAAIEIRVDGSGQVEILSETDLGTVVGNLVQVNNIPANQTLTLKKLVEGVTSEQSFQFEVSYIPLGQSEAVTLKPITLKHGESTELEIPYGAEVTIRETNGDGFQLSFRHGETSEPAGAIDGSYTFSMQENVMITAINTGVYRLPATGGTGTHTIYLMGGSLVLLAGISGLGRIRKKREA